MAQAKAPSWRTEFRLKRRGIYQRCFPSTALCIAGLLAMPALLFNPNTSTRILQFLLFWFLAWLAGKRNNPLITFIIMLVIVLCNLLVPYGRILATLGPFRITSGALLGGIHRAVTLEALIMLSKITIRQDLRLPGSFGEIIGESFRLLSLITEQRGRITRTNLVASIDALMIELSESSQDDPAQNGRGITEQSASVPSKKPNSIPIYCLLALFVLVSWAPLICQTFFYS